MTHEGKKIIPHYQYYYYYYLLQLSCHSVAVVLSLITNKNKYTQAKQYKNTVQRIQNTVNTSTHITKTPTHTHTHTLQNQLKQPQYKIHTKRNSHNTIKYPQYKVKYPQYKVKYPQYKVKYSQYKVKYPQYKVSALSIRSSTLSIRSICTNDLRTAAQKFPPNSPLQNFNCVDNRTHAPQCVQVQIKIKGLHQRIFDAGQTADNRTGDLETVRQSTISSVHVQEYCTFVVN